MLRLLRFLIAPLVSGLLLAAAFPLPGWSALAWLALVPLLLTSARRPFLSGYIAGFAFFAAALYWLNIVMVTYGRLPLALSVLAYLLLVSYLAIYFAFPVWLAERCKRRFGLPVYVSLPVFWIGFEFIRGLALTGFPWALVGYSQHANLNLIQSADLLGVYGIGALIILANGLLARILRAIWQLDRRSVPLLGCVIFALLFAGNWGYGQWRTAQGGERSEPTLRVGLVQGNIDQALKWDPAYQQATIQTYLELSEQAADDGARFLVWPESATPFYLQDPAPLSRAVQQMTRQTGAHLLTGSPAYERLPDGPRFLNSAFLLSPEGEFRGRSDKVHLVPFGEYVPLSRFLPFIDKLVVGIGNFSPGTIRPVSLNGDSFGVLVCYEAIFPELARAYTAQGSGLLVNITNDAWFGRSSAPYQHLGMARFRAIENRRYLVRSANTGISAIIDPTGAISASSPLFEPAVVDGFVAFRSELTIYTRFGDLLPIGSLLLGLLWLIRSQFRSNRGH